MADDETSLDDLIRLIRECGVDAVLEGMAIECVKAEVAAEREACAKVAEVVGQQSGRFATSCEASLLAEQADNIVEAIRARGQS